MTAAVTATVENAIQDWVVAGTGLAGDHVIWSAQNGPRPSTPYVALTLSELRGIGHDWTDVEDNLASTGSDGEEISHVARGVRTAVLQLQCFGGAATGATSAVALLEQLRARTALPTPAAILEAGGIGVGDFGAVRSIGAGLNTTIFEPRAVADVRFHLASEVSELGTYIEHVEVDGLVE